jgi:hypothetical protein
VKALRHHLVCIRCPVALDIPGSLLTSEAHDQVKSRFSNVSFSTDSIPYSAPTHLVFIDHGDDALLPWPVSMLGIQEAAGQKQML